MKRNLLLILIIFPSCLNLIFPKEIRGETYRFYYDKAIEKSDKGLHLEAINFFNKAIELKPNLWPAINNRGLDKFLMGDLQGAISDFSKTLEIKPSYANAFYYRGWAKDLNQDYKGAIKDLNSAIEIDEDIADYYFVLGNSYFKSGDLKSACSSWNKASNSSGKIFEDIVDDAKTMLKVCN